MFLISDAFRALDERRWREWDWAATTILLVSWDWDKGPEALASQRLVAPLLAAGARVHVLAAVGGHQTHSGTHSVTVVPQAPLAESKIVRTGQMLRRGIPERAGLWVGDAVRAGVQVLRSLPPDTIIYGRAMPGSSNIVAWHLARRTGLPWVAHFSDPWPPVQILSKRWNWLAGYKWPLFHFWRRRLLEDAGALTFTNPYQLLAFLGRDRQRHLTKAFVVTHLPSGPAREYRPPPTDVFHIVHTGSFYSLRGHNAAAFAQGLRLFLDRTPAARGRVRFTQAGWHNGDLPEWKARCGLDEVVSMVGWVSQAEVTDLLERASLLLVIDYALADSPILVSKLPDYVIARRPILAITAASSAMGRLFNEDGVGLIAHYDSPGEVATRIGSVFDAWQQRRFDAFLPQPTAIESFAHPRVLSELAAAFAIARQGHHVAGRQTSSSVELLRQRTTS